MQPDLPSAAEMADDLAQVDRRLLQQVAGEIAIQPNLLVILGAGASRDAGVSTFRDYDGLYQTHRPSDLASLAAFQRDPDGVWEWYRQRREQIAACEPHAGQRALALLEQHYGQRLLIVTTNEDDLLERAGCKRVVHMHGDIFVTRCTAGCGWRMRDVVDNAASYLPCPRCGAPVRPGSVWFGESLPPAALTVLDSFRADACLVIGSSGTVQPMAGVPLVLAEQGAPVVEINPQTTPLAEHIIRLPWRAATVLPLLIDLLTSATVRATTRERRWTKVDSETTS